MTTFLTIVITAIIITTIACQLYNKHIAAPVAVEQNKMPWEDFIIANINACKTTEECTICRKLIELFDKKFRGKIPPEIFNDLVEVFWNRLDMKYKVLKHQEEMSELTNDQLVN